MTSPWLDLLDATREGALSAAFCGWLESQVARACTRTGAPVVIPPVERADIAQDVLLKLVESGAAILARIAADQRGLAEAGVFDRTRAEAVPDALASADALLSRYVRVMAGHRYMTLLRARKREVPQDDTIEDVAANEAEDSGNDELQRALEVVRSALDHVVAHRPVDPEIVRRSMAELVDLVLGHRTMQDLVDECATTEAGDRVQIRDRIFRRHRLLRGYLSEALDELPLPHEDRVLARAALERVLNRRPNRARTSVPGAGDTP